SGFQPDAHHAVDQLFAQQVGRETQDVGVVMTAAHLSGDAVVAGGRADAAYLVGRDAHADASPANEDAAVHAPRAYRRSHLKGEVWIIDALPAGRPDVDDFVP